MQYKYYLATMPLPVDDINILDKIIQDEFHRYEIMELAHKENLYITADIQNKMITTIFTKVYKSLSDDLFNKFSIIFIGIGIMAENLIIANGLLFLSYIKKNILKI